MNINIVSENFVNFGAIENDLRGGTQVFPEGVYSSAHAPNRVKNELYGGAEVVLWQMAHLFLEKGHRVTVIQVGPEFRVFDYRGITIKTIPVPQPPQMVKIGITRKFHTLGFYWPRYVDKDADRIHLHYLHNGFPWGNSNMTGFSHGIDWDCPNYKSHLTAKTIVDRFHFFTMKAIVRFAVTKLRKIAANDSFFLRYVQSELPQHRDKVTLIPNFVDLSVFNPEVEANEMIVHKYEGKIKLLLPKSLSHARGTDIAIRSLSLLSRKDVVLLLPHVGPTQFYEKLASELGVRQQVEFLGHRDHFREMPDIYRSADIVIIPSHCREGTALAALEAMACEKPVLVSNVGGLMDIVIDGFNGSICGPDPTSLRNSLEMLIQKENLRHNLARQGREWVSRYYNKELWQKRMIQFFELR